MIPDDSRGHGTIPPEGDPSFGPSIPRPLLAGRLRAAKPRGRETVRFRGVDAIGIARYRRRLPCPPQREWAGDAEEDSPPGRAGPGLTDPLSHTHKRARTHTHAHAASESREGRPPPDPAAGRRRGPGPRHQGPGPGADAPPPPSLRAEPVCQPLSSRRGEGLGRASDSESDSEIRDPGRPGAFDRRSSDEPSSTVKHGSVRPADRRPLATFGRRRSRGPRDPGRTGAGAGALASETPSLAPGPPPSLRRPRGAGNGSCVMKDLQINLEWQHQTADSTLGDPGARATPRLGSLARVGFSS